MELIRINATLNKELILQIDDYADSMQEDRSTAIRQLLTRAILDRKRNVIFKAFKEKKITIRQAAESLGVDYWTIQEMLEEEGIPISDPSSLEIQQGKNWAKKG